MRTEKFPEMSKFRQTIIINLSASQKTELATKACTATQNVTVSAIKRNTPYQKILRNCPSLFITMDTPLSQFTTLNCSCGFFRKTGMGAILTIWHVMKNDRRVTALPKDSMLRHDCPKLTVAIEKKSINHLYLIRDNSIISK
jgi:hypothetical protein